MNQRERENNWFKGDSSVEDMHLPRRPSPLGAGGEQARKRQPWPQLPIKVGVLFRL